MPVLGIINMANVSYHIIPDSGNEACQLPQEQWTYEGIVGMSIDKNPMVALNVKSSRIYLTQYQYTMLLNLKERTALYG
jgi:hypothetical protein